MHGSTKLQNGTNRLLVSADVAIILGGSVHIVNTEASVVVSTEIGLYVNANETTSKVMYRDKNAGNFPI